MNQINYQKRLEEIVEDNQKEGKVPTLFLHSCCAPCSSYCLEYLSQYFQITVFYYNPNISPKTEYSKRVEEQKRLIETMNPHLLHKAMVEEGSYEPERFYEIAKGLEKEPEGGNRCFQCYELRLKETAILAKKRGFDYFTTTLSISPLKNAQKLNEIGEKVGEKEEISFLPSDFKKKNGYKRSIELSKEYNLYRQNYCGCLYSKNSGD
ncbi:MAG: epoxyqueuosine reductase QueH [Acetivibrio sp.]